MKKIRHITGVIAAGLVLSHLGGLTAQQSQQPGPVSSPEESAQSQAATLAYWTPERMASAIPMTPPERAMETRHRSRTWPW